MFNMNRSNSSILVFCRYHILLFFILFSTNILAQKTYYYKCSKCYDKNGVQQTNASEYYITFTNSVAYKSDANGNSKGEFIFKFRGRTSDGNLWYCHTMERPNVSYLPGIGINSYNTTDWTPGIGGEYIVSPDYSIINYRSGGYTFVMVRSTPSSNRNNNNEPTLIR